MSSAFCLANVAACNGVAPSAGMEVVVLGKVHKLGGRRWNSGYKLTRSLIVEHDSLHKSLHDMSVVPRDERQRTPLHLAAKSSDETMVRLLLEGNADPFLKDDLGRPPLFMLSLNHSAARQRTTVTELLLAAMARIMASGLEGVAHTVVHTVNAPFRIDADAARMW